MQNKDTIRNLDVQNLALRFLKQDFTIFELF